MTFQIPTINHESDKNKRWVIGTQPTISITGFISDPLGFKDPIDDTLEKAMRILEAMSEEYKSAGLELDAFQVKKRLGLKMLTIWELIELKSDINCSGEVTILNWCNDITWDGSPNSYHPEPTNIRLNLPLGDYAPNTKEFISSIWWDIDSLVGTFKKVWPMIVYKEPWKDNLVWDDAIKKMWIKLEPKPLKSVSWL